MNAPPPLRSYSRWLFPLISLLCTLLVSAARADPTCASCGKVIYHGTVFSCKDKMTDKKVFVCDLCEENLDDCFLCGVPASPELPGFLRLDDGRVICARDAKTAVLREAEGFRIFHEVRDSLDRLFSRFTGFPSKNIQLAMVDRVHLLELYALAGNDYHCPNTLGYTRWETNGTTVTHEINLMTGLPLTMLQDVCAHELTHTWVEENVPLARKATLAREAEEGFCELIAYLFASERNDEDEKAMILRNGYTRGQIDLFIAAERSYGLDDVLDWVRFGEDSKLTQADPARIRKVNLPHTKTTAPATPTFVSQPAPESPTTLKLKAVFWDPKRPLALVNNCTLGIGESGQVRVGTTNVTVRCVAITQNSVKLNVGDPETQQELVVEPANKP